MNKKKIMAALISQPEIKSWKDFRYSLREENALLFNEMLSECGRNKDYIKAASFKCEYYSAESLLCS